MTTDKTAIGCDDSVVRILLVEDHPIAAKAVLLNLATLGDYTVDVADRGQLACDMALKHSYQLILMDIGLPDMDGYEVTRLIRQYEANSLKKKRLPIVALTAHSNEESRRQCFEAGIDMIVIKPLMRANLHDIIHFAFSTDKNKMQGIPQQHSDSAQFNLLKQWGELAHA